jgi:hypothetical protein
MDPVRQIADAVLYEGYVLWPYRRSALKNQRRWTFGGVHPRTHSERHPDDAFLMRTECLVEGADPEVRVTVRFLHVVERQVAREGPDGPELVDELTVDGRRHLAWQEAVEREVAIPALGPDAQRRSAIDVPAGREEEPLVDGDGRRAGALIRSWEPLAGAVTVAVERLAPELARVTVAIENASPFDGEDRQEALRRTFCSTHTVLRAVRGAFVSLTDPPRELRDEAQACRNQGAWPVLVGEPGERHTLLSSPIILEDHPRIAPESPGDLFDGGEIDGLLTLSILSLTDEEKAEMRDSDPRVREILERTEALTEDERMRMHGAIRDLRVVRP